jgi:alpha-galactosidase
MKALADYVHSRGLKLGIYSSPGPKTCAGYTASYQYEVQDAATYAGWGVDYLKYDWCSYDGVVHGDHSLPALEKPYAVMRDALDKAPRDIVYSLCQYGMGDSWEWAGSAPILGNCWRTTGDINDSWGSLSGIGFRQNGHEVYGGPGHWNDPDMLVVGKLGWGDHPHPTHLTGNEQITHISLWCLLSAPLLIGCDLTQIEPFTKALLTNDEILDIDQDPLGKPAGRKVTNGDTQIWARPLFDGTMAVGLFNLGSEGADVTVKFSDLGLKGSQPVRDLWQHIALRPTKDSVTMHVPAHGAVVLKVGKPQRTDYTP